MQIESIINRVRQYYPGCCIATAADGLYYIEHDGQNLNDTFLFDNCDSIDAAWILALESTKIHQNINRTHPLKKMFSNQKKIQNRERISNRIHGHRLINS